MAGDPYSQIADPVSANDPYAQIADPADAQASAQSDQSVPDGFTPEQQQAIRGYLPKAKDAADLTQFAHDVSGGTHTIGNAQQILDYLKKGGDPSKLQFTDPVAAQAPAQQPSTLENLRNTIGEGILNALDGVIPGLGSVLRGNRDSGKAFTEHVANSMVGDYGPEVGGFLHTIASPSDYGDFGASLDRNVAHERAIMQGDSADHGAASLAGELGGTGIDAMLGNEAGLGNLSRLGKTAVAAGQGAIYGSGAAGPGNRVAGAITGAALGAATDAVAPVVSRYVSALKGGATNTAAALYPDAAKAAQQLGIDLPKFVVGGTKDAKTAAALEQTALGSGPIVKATNKMLDQSEAARNSIAADLGVAANNSAQMGDQALDAAVAKNKQLRSVGGALYDQARKASDGVTIAPTHTLANIDTLLAEENGRIGGSKIAPILQQYRDDLQNAGQITVDQARNLRTDLREQLSSDAAATPDKTDRIVNTVMAGVNDDMASGLASKPDALALYKEADANWAQQRELEDSVLKPFLGKNFDNWGDDVAKRIYADAKGNGTRLARFLGSLPEDDANRVRATLVQHLGTASNGAQNAAGDAFSLDTFLTNWNEMKGSRNLVFPKDTVQSLDRLATVAEAAKNYSRKLNRSNTGGVVSYLTQGAPTALGAGGAIFTHDPKLLAYGMMLSGMRAVRQYGAAKLLASPTFAKKLASTPMNEAGARAFWSRPWVNAIAAKEPAIAAEIKAFQSAFLNNANDNSAASLAAQPQSDNQDQSAQAQ